MARSALIDWLDARTGIRQLGAFFREKEVPLHRHTLWYYTGGITLFFLLVQIVTGILLLIYYRPTAESAYESVKFIMTEVHFGWLIRSLHSWSANLMVGSAFVHMFSAFMLRAYRPPRELTWITGVLLFFLTLSFGFSGYLLPWNALSYFATKVGTEVLGALPLLGKPLRLFLRGGEDVSGATLTRFFGIHVAILPACLVVILTIHLLLVQIQGMSDPRGSPGEAGNRAAMPFYPNFLLRDLIGWSLALVLLMALASIFPWELGEKADPFAAAPAGIRPEWYFLFMFETLKFVPARLLLFEGEKVAAIAFAVGGALWLLVPFLDRAAARGITGRLFPVIGWLLIVYIVAMTALAYLLPVAP